MSDDAKALVEKARKGCVWQEPSPFSDPGYRINEPATDALLEQLAASLLSSEERIRSLEEDVIGLKGALSMVKTERGHVQVSLTKAEGERDAERAEVVGVLEEVREAIIQHAPDTLWVSLIETAVDCIDAALAKLTSQAGEGE